MKKIKKKIDTNQVDFAPFFYRRKGLFVESSRYALACVALACLVMLYASPLPRETGEGTSQSQGLKEGSTFWQESFQQALTTPSLVSNILIRGKG